MKRILAAALLLIVVCPLVVADERSDGADEILAVVNGKAITYQQIVGDLDMQAEINATRTVQRVPADIADSEIEQQLVFQRLRNYILQRLLDAEADRVQLKISDSQMRGIIIRQKKNLGLRDDDVKAWASYLKEKFNLTPGEYLERTRGEIRRNEILNYMAGLYGPLPAQFPLEIYFSLSVTPRDVREEFDRTADSWRIARNIDYRRFRLLYPPEVARENQAKLYSAVLNGDNSVRERVIKGESMERASDGLKKLIEDLGIPGAQLELGERKTAKDDSDLDPLTYQMVLSVPANGGISELGYAEDTDDEGQKLEGFQFVQLFSREDGDRRNYESPKVQEGIRAAIERERLSQNQAKVERALLKRAAIVPEKLFQR
ncbi:MAG: SurA N-terminal domain-containing protein [Planctomycetes bacterium]|nr:SurA N-terminal domain-containing protein [Planctomycetota bacterium]